MLVARLFASSVARQSQVGLQHRLLSVLATTARDAARLSACAEAHPDASRQSSGAGSSSSLPHSVLPRHHQQLFPDAASLAHGAHQQRRTLFGDSSDGWGATKKFSQRRLVGWSPEQLYNVISHVEDYHKFVPWCQKSKIISIVPDQRLEAELEVGFQMLKEKYTSKVTLKRPSLVTSSVANSTLFHHLDNMWKMDPGPTPQSCWLTFDVEFAFTSALYRHAADMFFSEVVKRMTGAFETRCGVLYGPSSFVRPAACARPAPACPRAAPTNK